MDETKFIEEALKESDLNAMRIALLQATDDEVIASLDVSPRPVRAGAGTIYDITGLGRDVLIHKAMEFLRGDLSVLETSVPNDELLRKLMALAAGDKPLSEADFQVRKPILAFEKFPRFVSPDNKVQVPDSFNVGIIGAGFSGLCMAVQLEVLGIPYVVYERRHEIGGTWSINNYPAARVDTPSSVYEFSFEKKYPWSEYFAQQGEVRNYLEHVARKYKVYDKIRFNCDVQGGRFDDSAGRWVVEYVNCKGEMVKESVSVLVSGAGLFSIPKKLELEGAANFAGNIFHSTEWSDMTVTGGKRVAIIGNGSTGVQILKDVREVAEQVYVFQRTPQWISPREKYGEKVTAGEVWLEKNMPYYWNWKRYTNVLTTADLYELMVPDTEWQSQGGIFNEKNDKVRQYLTQYIKSELEGRSDLIEKLVPTHLPFSRRLVIDNGWYRSLCQENVELVTDSIVRFSPQGIVTKDGTERAIDVVISATGFSVEKYLWPAEYIGREGEGLQTRWSREGARAYLGMMVDGFPNFFILNGPNSLNAVGDVGTLPTQAEMWAGYIGQLLMSLLEKHGRTIEVTGDALRKYNERLDEASKGTIWMIDGNSASKNYWLSNGRLQVNFPWRHSEMFWMLEKPAYEDFVFT